MNHRENLLSLLRRKGFEYIPPQFGLTPHLVDVYREKTGSDLSYQDFFDMPWRDVPDIKVTDNTGKFLAWYWLKPRLKKVIDEVKNFNPDIIIMYHSCGYVLPFIRKRV